MTSLLLLILLATARPAEPADPVHLSLEDCVTRALESNLSILGGRIDAEVARQAFGAVWGDFDTSWFFDATASERINAPGGAIFIDGQPVAAATATDFDLADYAFGLRGTLLSGVQWQVEAGSTKTFSNTPGVLGMPGTRVKQYRADWNVSLTVPLLRSGGDFARRALDLALADAHIAWAQSEDLAIETIQLVIEAYWNLFFAERDLATRELSVELAEELLNITQRRFQEGLQTRIDVVESEAELASRREELLTASYALQQAADDLRRLVFAPEARDDWDHPIVLETQPQDPSGDAPAMEAAVDTALRHRPDVLEAQVRLERAEVAVERARNQVHPRLDATGFYGQNSNESGFQSAFRSLDDGSFRSFGAVLNWEMPIGNRGAEHALRQAELQRQRDALGLREAEIGAVSEVRSAVREVALQAERVAATAETVRLNEERYQGQIRQLENDLSTQFQVREAQRDLLTAIDTNTRAILDYEIARSNLLRSQGTLLTSYGVLAVPPDLSLEEPLPEPGENP